MPVSLTAQQKVDRGLPLTAEDIRELLKNPNSWVAKLYQASLQEAATIKLEWFIHYVECVMREEYLTRIAEKAEERAQMRADEKRQQAAFGEMKSEGLLDSKYLPESLVLIKTLDTTTMVPMLIAHRQQVLAQLGPVIALQNGMQLRVPPAAPPVVALSKILAVNPALTEQLQVESGEQPAGQQDLMQSLIQFHLRAETGFKLVLNLTRKLFEHNGYDMDNVDPSIVKEVRNIVDATVKRVNNENKEKVLEQAISHVQSLLQHSTLHEAHSPVASLTKPPATFATHPHPGQRKVVDKEEEEQNRHNLRKK